MWNDSILLSQPLGGFGGLYGGKEDGIWQNRYQNGNHSLGILDILFFNGAEYPNHVLLVVAANL